MTGDLEDIEAGGEKANQREQMLHIDLHDLVTAKRAFARGRADADAAADAAAVVVAADPV